MHKLNGHRSFIVVLIISLLFRLFLLPYGNHNDLITNTGWSDSIYNYGARGFYENRPWVYDSPTQFPIVNLIYGFNFILFKKILSLITFLRVLSVSFNLFPSFKFYIVNLENWFGWTYYVTYSNSTAPFMNGHIFSMKLIPIFSDIAIAVLIYLIALKFVNKRIGLITSLVYLFVPYTAYLSSLWGQYDQFSALFLLLSFYLVHLAGNSKETRSKVLYFLLSAVFYLISLEVKPTIAFTVPFYIFYFLRQGPSITHMFLSLLSVFSVYYLTTALFVTEGNVFSYTLDVILPKVMFQGRYVLSTQAFNFWELVSPIRQNSFAYLILGLPSVYWGYIFIIVLNMLAIFRVLRDDGIKSMLSGLFIVAGGSYIFATGMLDRYYFAGLLSFLILTMFYKKTLFLWVLAASIFSLNLFFSWGYPINLQIHDIFWINYPIVRLLSFLQFFLFLSMAYRIFKEM